MSGPVGERRSLEVLDGGLLTTVQDLGRPGHARFGVAPGGALDRAALTLGNRLVGNAPGAAGLEATLVGPRLRFALATVVAVTGADLGATLDGRPAPRWRPFAVPAGGVLAFGAPAGGARAYVCVAGGVATPPVLGSRSTDLTGRFGGLDGRALRAGDAVPLGEPAGPTDGLLRRALVGPPPGEGESGPIRVVLGPQEDRFSAGGLATFLGSRYAVSTRADRMGLRLDGPAVACAEGADHDLVSEGIAAGAVQVPGDGRPIVLLAARQTIGGYPKIATAIGADLDRLGQLAPGDSLRFAAVGLEEARALTLAHLAALGEDAVAEVPRPGRGWVPPDEGAGNEAAGQAVAGEGGEVPDGRWDPEGVVRVIRALAEAGVTAFRLSVASAGLEVELRRDAGGELATVAPGGDVPAAGPTGEEADDLVRAPVLGTFYRRESSDGPPLAEVGQAVTAGQALAMIEVMKTYHGVTVPRDGTLAEFLVEDGATVEYGQPLARLAPLPA